MTDIDLKKMREIAEKATPGEWKYRPRRHDDWGWVLGEGGYLVACARAGGEYDANQHRTDGTDPFKPNADYIVAAQPRNVLALLDRLEAAEAERDAARALLKRAGEAVKTLVGGTCPECKGGGEVTYFGELVACRCGGNFRYAPTDRQRSDARAVADEIEETLNDRP